MLDTYPSSQPIMFTRNSTNYQPVSFSWTDNNATVATADNWEDVLLTPDNIINIKKPLSPPKKRESYASLQDFLLNGSTKSVETDTTTRPSTSPPAGKSPSPEKTRWAGPAFCNSPAPKELPKPTFISNGTSASSGYHRSHSLPVFPIEPPQSSESDVGPQHPNYHSVPAPNRKLNSPKKLPFSKTREDINVSPSKKKGVTYVPKQKNPVQPAPQAAVVPAPQTTVQLEEMSNQLKQMLNLKTA